VGGGGGGEGRARARDITGAGPAGPLAADLPLQASSTHVGASPSLFSLSRRRRAGAILPRPLAGSS